MQAAPALAIRNKILGALLKHARLRAGRLPDEYAQVFGCTEADILRWESGETPITLSQLEVWAHLSGVPLSFFWNDHALPQRREVEEPVQPIMQIRRKMVGVLLRQSRLIAARSLEDLAQEIGVTPEYLEACEAGTKELSVAQLELAAEACGVPIAQFFDEDLFAPSEEERRMRDLHRLDELPPDLREFVLKPSNALYLKIAKQISALSADTLREIAETLLDITL
ncbi:MAG: helix-turn-helix transcriptional regulator [Chloroflexi bacterium]|nr:helix-turn-helix transcriptional regulator [Chloroflexota bacterium]